MELAMVKLEQGETLRKYMWCFFDKRATVVDVTDKEVIDLFQDDLYHRRTFEASVAAARAPLLSSKT
jgi:hypothetical protein